MAETASCRRPAAVRILAALAAAVCLLAVFGGFGSRQAYAAEAGNVTFSIPTKVPCAIVANGDVVSPSGWEIRNLGDGEIRLSNVSVESTDTSYNVSAYEGSDNSGTKWLNHWHEGAQQDTWFDQTRTVPAKGMVKLRWWTDDLSWAARHSVGPGAIKIADVVFSFKSNAKTAFAVYSADDQSLNFYKRMDVPAVGDTFEGKAVTEVYTGIETAVYDPVIPDDLNGDINTPWLGHAGEILSVTVVDEGIYPNCMWAWFQHFKNCASFDVSKLNTSAVTSFGHVFFGCLSVKSIDISSWDMSKANGTVAMFGNSKNLTSVQFGTCDFSKVKNFGWMFAHCDSLVIDCSDWTVRKDAEHIAFASYAPGVILPKAWQPTAFAVFSADDGSLDFYKREYRKVPKAGDTFEGKAVTEVYTGIEDAEYRDAEDIPWYAIRSDIVSVRAVDRIAPKDMGYMFYGCKRLENVELSNLDASNATNMSFMFDDCSSLTSLDLSGWDASRVISMYALFSGCSSLASLELPGWNTSNVIDMGYMFDDCSSLTGLDLSGWDMSKIEQAPKMPDSLTSFRADGLVLPADCSYMFLECSSLTGLNPSSWDVSHVTNMDAMFYGCSALTSLDLSGWDTSSVTNMDAMFEDCSGLATIDGISGWDTSNATDMNAMFSGCSALTGLDLSGWDVSHVTRMLNLFNSCNGLTELDLSGWNTSSVTDMTSMFRYCSNLTTAGNLSHWDTSSVTDMVSTFEGCYSLVVDCSNWDVSNVSNHSYFNDDAYDVIAPNWNS